MRGGGESNVSRRRMACQKVASSPHPQRDTKLIWGDVAYSTDVPKPPFGKGDWLVVKEVTNARPTSVSFSLPFLLSASPSPLPAASHYFSLSIVAVVFSGPFSTKERLSTPSFSPLLKWVRFFSPSSLPESLALLLSFLLSLKTPFHIFFPLYSRAIKKGKRPAGTKGKENTALQEEKRPITQFLFCIRPGIVLCLVILQIPTAA